MEVISKEESPIRTTTKHAFTVIYNPVSLCMMNSCLIDLAHMNLKDSNFYARFHQHTWRAMFANILN
jgi:hypothetical protein